MKLIPIAPEKAAIMWRVKNGEIKGTKEQREFVARVKRFFLNRYNAPKSYLEKYPYKPYDSGPVRVGKNGRVVKEELVQQARLPYID